MTVHTVPNEPKKAERNRRTIEDALRGGGTACLPPGITYIDQNVRLGPDHSGSTLAGAGMGASVLRQVGAVWPENCGVVIAGEGYADPGASAAELPDDANLAEGAMRVPWSWRLAEGTWAYITSGPAFSDPLTGEFRRIVVRGDDTFLDRPLRRTYRNVRLATGRPVVDVTIRDLTIAQPEHGQAYKLLIRRAVGVRCERVRFGLPGDSPAGWGPAECAGLTLVDCDSSNAPLGLNTAHDTTIIRGQYLSIVGEENCLDCDIEGPVRITPGGQKVPGIRWYLGSERLRIRNVRIEGGGALADEGGSHAPLNLYGRECRVDGLDIVGTLHWGIGLGGDRLDVYGLRSDVETWVTEGTDVTLRDCQAPSWVVLPATTGRASGCPGLSEQEGWDVERDGASVPVAARSSGMGSNVADGWKRRRPVIDWSAVRGLPPGFA